MANQPNQSPTQEFTPMSGVLLRMYWFFIGHAAVALLTINIIQEHQHGSAIYNGAFLLAAASTFLARFIDIKFFKGETGDGRKSTMRDFFKWSIQVAAAYGAGFAAIHLSPLIVK